MIEIECALLPLPLILQKTKIKKFEVSNKHFACPTLHPVDVKSHATINALVLTVHKYH